MRLTSEALRDGQIPVRYSKDGENVSPPLAWSDLPAGVEELALLLENITPRTKTPFVQWLVYKIPADRRGCRKATSTRATKEPVDVRAGPQLARQRGYDGPLGTCTGPSAIAFGCSRSTNGWTCRPASTRRRFLPRRPAMSSSRRT